MSSSSTSPTSQISDTSTEQEPPPSQSTQSQPSTSDSAVVSLLYHPHMDPQTHELATLNSMLIFCQATPVNGSLIYELFPDITPYIFSNSIAHDGLRHSLLSMAAIVRDIFSQRELSSLYFDQKSKCLSAVQRSLSHDLVDESVSVAILGQVFTDICMGDMKVIKRHLAGLLLIYKHLKKRGKLTPNARLVARVAARVDVTTAYYFGDDLVWPAFTPLDEMDDRKWMTSRKEELARSMKPRDIEWALAGFEIDNLWHLTYKFARYTYLLRLDGDANAEQKILVQFRVLQQYFEGWKRRGQVIEQEEIERITQLTAKASSTPEEEMIRDPFNLFLDYEYLPLQDLFYAKLLNQYRAAQIYSSLQIPHPDPSSRRTWAIDICRTTASLGYEAFSGPQWECLFYAGCILRKREESQWIVERCGMIAAQMPVLRPHVDRMERAWVEGEGDWNPFGRVFPRREDSWIS